MITQNKTLSGRRATERRCHRRVPTVETVELHFDGSMQLASTHDISLGGLGLRVDDPPMVGELVDVVLNLSEDSPIRIESVVVRVGEVVGLRFLDLEPHEAFQLCAYAAAHDRRPS